MTPLMQSSDCELGFTVFDRETAVFGIHDRAAPGVLEEPSWVSVPQTSET